MSKKTLTGVLAGVLSLGIVTPAMATEVPNLDALNKAAYDAVVVAQKEGTQASINKARKAVQALKEAKPDSEHILGIVSNYSSALDKVQHPILSAAITATLAAEKSGTQADINAAFKVLPTELLELDGTSEGNKDIWRNKYRDLSSILDKAQLALQTKASEAVKKAQDEKSSEAVAAAQALVSEIATSNKEAIKKWAATMQERIDAIVIQELVITEVVRINETTVDVKFDKLAEELQNVTVEVKDANGTVYEVNELDFIEKGATKASFTFKKSLEKAPKGKWTVNGVGYNANAQNTVDEVKAADTQQKLADALEAYGDFINYDVNNVGYYFELLNTNRDKLTTIADIQTLVVDAGNKDAKYAEKVAYVKASSNNVVLGQRLVEVGFEKVNKNWLDDYNAPKGGDITNPLKLTKYSDIQAHLNTKNIEKIEKAVGEVVNTSIDAKKVVEVTGVVNEFYPEDSTENKNAKKTALDKLAVQKAICSILDATSPESVVSAIQNLATLDKTFKLDHLNVNLGKEYIDAFNHSSAVATVVNTSSKIDSALEKINTNATTVAVNKLFEVVDIIDTTDKEAFIKNNKANEDFEAAIDKLAKASAKEATKFNAAVVKKASNFEYVEKLKADSTMHTVAGANGAIETVNTNAIANVFTDVNEDTLMEKLNNIVSNYGLTNVESSNKDVYVDNIKLFQWDRTNTANPVNPFEEVGRSQLSVLQRKINKLNDIATMVSKHSTLQEITTALKDYREILIVETSGENVIPNTTTPAQINDIALLLSKVAFEFTEAHNDNVVDTFETHLEKAIADQKKIIVEINEALQDARNAKFFDLAPQKVVTPDKEVDIIALRDILRKADASITTDETVTILDNFAEIDFNKNGKVEADDNSTFTSFGEVTALRK